MPHRPLAAPAIAPVQERRGGPFDSMGIGDNGCLVDLESRAQDVSRDRSSAAALEPVFSRGKRDFTSWAES